MQSTPAEPGAGPLPSTVVLAAGLLAAAVPPLLAFNLPPSATVLNQCLAMALWGGFALVLQPGAGLARTATLQASVAALGAGVLLSWLGGSLPAAMALSALALLAGGGLLAWAGSTAAQQAQGSRLFGVFCAGLALAGLLSASVAIVQVFAPGWTDGAFIAHSTVPGRAVGNLRQPNHLCSLLLWAAIAVAALLELGHVGRRSAILAMLLLVFAVELSASRTGAAGLLLLAAWGLLDRRLSRSTRWLLVATPFIYAASYLAMLGWSAYSDQAVGVGARMASEATGIESPNSRSRIWANAIALIRQQPWGGVGFGEFNAAWSLTPFPGRPTAFFDHTHNLPLQLAVELGLPLAGLVMALLAWSLWRAWARCRGGTHTRSIAATAAWLMVAMILWHSLVEYPLWYSYFLLPTAFAWGFAIGAPAGDPTEAPARNGRAGALLSLLLVVGGCAAVFDYLRVVVIYEPRESSGSLTQRIAIGQRSVFFAQHADYAAATVAEPVPGRALAFARAPHYLLDTRLMVAWAQYLAERGELDKARALAERLREFRNPESESFFAPCSQGETQPFQCQRQQSAPPWRSYFGTR